MFGFVASWRILSLRRWPMDWPDRTHQTQSDSGVMNRCLTPGRVAASNTVVGVPPDRAWRKACMLPIPFARERSMKLRHRRAVLMGLGATAIGAFSTGPARAQAAYPTQPIKFIIPAGAGCRADTRPRLQV